MKFINPHKLYVGSFIPEWLERRSDVSPGAKLVYARLCRFAGKDGIAYPKIETLSESLAMNERSVKRYLKELRTLNLIDAEIRGLGKASIYRFIDPEHDKNCHGKGDKSCTVEVTEVVPNGDNNCTVTVQDLSPPILRESIEENQFKRINGRERAAREKKEEKNSELGESTSIHSEKMKVLAYLHKKTNAPIQPGGGRPGQYIEQLFNQGYTKEQMIKVIDRKAELFQAGEIPALYVAAHVIFKPENFTTEIFMLDNPEKKNGKIEKDAFGRVVIDDDRDKWLEVKKQVESGNF